MSESEELFSSTPDLILTTKLYKPPLTTDIIPRARLTEQMEEGRQRAITLVSAPAGYGKSILVSQWLEICQCPDAWVSLDEDDNNLRIFLTYLLEAIHKALPYAKLKTKTLLQASSLPPVKVLSRYLLNDLEKADEPFILVLDDYHRISEMAVHDLLAELLLYPSPKLHLVLITRRDPPLPLAKLRSYNQLTEIRLELLRFTLEETTVFLERFLKITIDESMVALLEEKIEGWIAGVRLIALSIRKEDRLNQILEGLKEDSLYVTDYLLREVISGMPPDRVRTLMRISILNRFCEPLCDALFSTTEEKTDAVNGQKFIDWLEETHLFVIPLDKPHTWFRFHHVFQDLLQKQLKHLHSPEEISGFHSRASEWFEAKDLIDEALHHALAAGDALAAAQIVERNRRAALDADRWLALGMLLERLPHEIIQVRPQLLLGQAWILLQNAQIAEIFPIIERLESLVNDDCVEQELLCEINFFRGLLLYCQGDGARSAELFIKATEQIPHQNALILLRAEAEYWISLSLHLDGQKEAAIRRLHGEIRSRDVREWMMLSRLIFGLCFIHMLDGECPQAFQEGLRLSEVDRLNCLEFVEPWAQYVQGNASFQMFDLDAAWHHFSLVMENRYISNRRAAVDALAALAITCQFMGEPDKADEVMRLAQEYAQWGKDPLHLDIVRSCSARLALLRDDLDSASRWQRSLKESPGIPLMLFFLEIPVITECRVLIAIGTDAGLKETIERLDDLLQKSKAWHITYHVIEIMVLKALAIHRQGRLDEALDVLEQAVAMAMPGGCIRPFIELGKPIADMLARLSKQNVSVKYVGKLLAAFRSEASSKLHGETYHKTPVPLSLSDDSFVEPLSNRELQVVSLLAKRLSNKEIAEKMFISPETVKKHLYNIFQKLNAKTRRQAVEKANALGIL